MTRRAIDVCYRVADRLPLRRSGAISNMAGITTRIHNGRVCVVWVGIQKTDSGMAVTAFNVGNRVAAGWCIGGSWCLTRGHSAVVATAACPGNIRVIKTAIRCQFKKMASIVAFIAFDCGCRMKFRFTDGDYTVMTFAAIAKYFLMIDKRDNIKVLGGMTGLAGITAGNVIRCFREKYLAVYLGVNAVMTIHAIRRQAWMIKTAGQAFARIGDHDSGNGALTGNAFSTDYQLHHVDTTNIGDETGRRCAGALQYGITAFRFKREGPAIVQSLR